MKFPLSVIGVGAALLGGASMVTGLATGQRPLGIAEEIASSISDTLSGFVFRNPYSGLTFSTGESYKPTLTGTNVEGSRYTFYQEGNALKPIKIKGGDYAVPNKSDPDYTSFVEVNKSIQDHALETLGYGVGAAAGVATYYGLNWLSSKVITDSNSLTAKVFENKAFKENTAAPIKSRRLGVNFAVLGVGILAGGVLGAQADEGVSGVVAGAVQGGLSLSLVNYLSTKEELGPRVAGVAAAAILGAYAVGSIAETLKEDRNTIQLLEGNTDVNNPTVKRGYVRPDFYKSSNAYDLAIKLDDNPKGASPHRYGDFTDKNHYRYGSLPSFNTPNLKHLPIKNIAIPDYEKNPAYKPRSDKSMGGESANIIDFINPVGMGYSMMFVTSMGVHLIHKWADHQVEIGAPNSKALQVAKVISKFSPFSSTVKVWESQEKLVKYSSQVGTQIVKGDIDEASKSAVKASKHFVISQWDDLVVKNSKQLLFALAVGVTTHNVIANYQYNRKPVLMGLKTQEELYTTPEAYKNTLPLETYKIPDNLSPRQISVAKQRINQSRYYFEGEATRFYKEDGSYWGTFYDSGTVGEGFMQFLRDADDNSLKGAFYDLDSDREFLELVKRKFSDDNLIVSMGSNKNIGEALSPIVDDLLPNTLPILGTANALYAKAVNLFTSTTGLGLAYQQKGLVQQDLTAPPLTNPNLEGVANAFAYGALLGTASLFIPRQSSLRSNKGGAAIFMAGFAVGAAASTLTEVLAPSVQSNTYDFYHFQRFGAGTSRIKDNLISFTEAYAYTQVAPYKQVDPSEDENSKLDVIYGSTAVGVTAFAASYVLLGIPHTGTAPISSTPQAPLKRTLSFIRTNPHAKRVAYSAGIGFAVGSTLGLGGIGRYLFTNNVDISDKTVPVYQGVTYSSAKMDEFAINQMHAKVMINTKTDEAFISTGNIGELIDNSRGGGYQINYAVRIKDKELVKDLAVFLDFLKENKSDNKADRTSMLNKLTSGRLIVTGGQQGGLQSRETASELITQGTGDLYISVAYTSDEDLGKSIIHAAKSGRKVYIKAQNPQGIAQGGIPEKQILFWQKILEETYSTGNLQLYFTDRANPMLQHAKDLISGSVKWMGSTNLSKNSDFNSDEVAAFIDNQAYAEAGRKAFQRDLLIYPFINVTENPEAFKSLLTQGNSTLFHQLLTKQSPSPFIQLFSPKFESSGFGESTIPMTHEGVPMILPSKLDAKYFKLTNKNPELYENLYRTIKGQEPEGLDAMLVTNLSSQLAPRSPIDFLLHGGMGANPNLLNIPVFAASGYGSGRLVEYIAGSTSRKTSYGLLAAGAVAGALSISKFFRGNYENDRGVLGTALSITGKLLDLLTGQYASQRIADQQRGVYSGSIREFHRLEAKQGYDKGLFESALTFAGDFLKGTASGIGFYFLVSHSWSIFMAKRLDEGTHFITELGSSSSTPRAMMTSDILTSEATLILQKAGVLAENRRKLTPVTPGLVDTVSPGSTIDDVITAIQYNALKQAGASPEVLASFEVADDAQKALGYPDRYDKINRNIASVLAKEGVDLSVTEEDQVKATRGRIDDIFEKDFGYKPGSMDLSKNWSGRPEGIRTFQYIGIVRSMESLNFINFTLPILENISVVNPLVPSEVNKWKGAVEGFLELLTAPPVLKYHTGEHGVASAPKIENFGFMRMQNIARYMDDLAQFIPASPLYYLPQVRQVLGVTSLRSYDRSGRLIEGSDRSIKPLLGSGFQGLVKTAEIIFNTVDTILKEGLKSVIVDTFKSFKLHRELQEYEQKGYGEFKTKYETLKEVEDFKNQVSTFKQQGAGAQIEGTPINKKLKTSYGTFFDEFTSTLNPEELIAYNTKIKELNTLISKRSSLKELTQIHGADSTNNRLLKAIVAVGSLFVVDRLVDDNLMQSQSNDPFIQLAALVKGLYKGSFTGYGSDKTEQEYVQAKFQGESPYYLKYPMMVVGGLTGGHLFPDIHTVRTLPSLVVDHLNLSGHGALKVAYDVKTPSITFKQVLPKTPSIPANLLGEIGSTRKATRFSYTGAAIGAAVGLLVGAGLATNLLATGLNFLTGNLRDKAFKGNSITEASILSLTSKMGALKQEIEGKHATQGKTKTINAKDYGDIGVAWLLAAALRRGEREQSRPIYTSSIQIPTPLFQLAFVNKLDPRGNVVTYGAGFQFFPILGAGLTPTLPLQVRVQWGADSRLLTFLDKTAEKFYQAKERNYQQTGSHSLYKVDKQRSKPGSTVYSKEPTEYGKIMLKITEARQGYAKAKQTFAESVFSADAASPFFDALTTSAILSLSAYPIKGIKRVISQELGVEQSLSAKRLSTLSKLGSGLGTIYERLVLYSQVPNAAAPLLARHAIAGMARKRTGVYLALQAAFVGSLYGSASIFSIPLDAKNDRLLNASVPMALVGAAALSTWFGYKGTELQFSRFARRTMPFALPFVIAQASMTSTGSNGFMGTEIFYESFLKEGGSLGQAIANQQLYKASAALGTALVYGTAIQQSKAFSNVLHFSPNTELYEDFITQLTREVSTSSDVSLNALKEGVSLYSNPNEALRDKIAHRVREVADVYNAKPWKEIQEEVGDDVLTKMILTSRVPAFQAFPRRLRRAGMAYAAAHVGLNVLGQFAALGAQEDFLTNPIYAPLRLATGIDAFKLSKEERQGRISSGIPAGLYSVPTSLKDVASNLYQTAWGMLGPLKDLARLTGIYQDTANPFLNVFGPFGISEGTRGFKAYTQVQTSHTDVSGAVYEMNPDVISTDLAIQLGTILNEESSDLGVALQRLRGATARTTPMTLKGNLTSYEMEGLGSSQYLSRALAVRNLYLTNLSWQRSLELSSDFYREHLVTGRIATDVLPGIQVERTAWSPYDMFGQADFMVSRSAWSQPSSLVNQWAGMMRRLYQTSMTGYSKPVEDPTGMIYGPRGEVSSAAPFMSYFWEVGKFYKKALYEDRTTYDKAFTNHGFNSIVGASSTVAFALASILSVAFSGVILAGSFAAQRQGGVIGDVEQTLQDLQERLSTSRRVRLNTTTNEVMYGMNGLERAVNLNSVSANKVSGQLAPTSKQIRDNFSAVFSTSDDGLNITITASRLTKQIADVNSFFSTTSSNAREFVDEINSYLRSQLETEVAEVPFYKFFNADLDEIVATNSVRSQGLIQELEELKESNALLAIKRLNARAKIGAYVVETFATVERSSQPTSAATEGSSSALRAERNKAADRLYKPPKATVTTKGLLSAAELVDELGYVGVLKEAGLGLGEASMKLFNLSNVYPIFSSLSRMSNPNEAHIASLGAATFTFDMLVSGLAISALGGGAGIIPLAAAGVGLYLLDEFIASKQGKTKGLIRTHGFRIADSINRNIRRPAIRTIANVTSTLLDNSIGRVFTGALSIPFKVLDPILTDIKTKAMRRPVTALLSSFLIPDTLDSYMNYQRGFLPNRATAYGQSPMEYSESDRHERLLALQSMYSSRGLALRPSIETTLVDPSLQGRSNSYEQHMAQSLQFNTLGYGQRVWQPFSNSYRLSNTLTFALSVRQIQIDYEVHSSYRRKPRSSMPSVFPLFTVNSAHLYASRLETASYDGYLLEGADRVYSGAYWLGRSVTSVDPTTFLPKLVRSIPGVDGALDVISTKLESFNNNTLKPVIDSKIISPIKKLFKSSNKAQFDSIFKKTDFAPSFIPRTYAQSALSAILVGTTLAPVTAGLYGNVVDPALKDNEFYQEHRGTIKAGVYTAIYTGIPLAAFFHTRQRIIKEGRTAIGFGLDLEEILTGKQPVRPADMSDEVWAKHKATLLQEAPPLQQFLRFGGGFVYGFTAAAAAYGILRWGAKSILNPKEQEVDREQEWRWSLGGGLASLISGAYAAHYINRLGLKGYFRDKALGVGLLRKVGKGFENLLNKLLAKDIADEANFTQTITTLPAIQLREEAPVSPTLFNKYRQFQVEAYSRVQTVADAASTPIRGAARIIKFIGSNLPYALDIGGYAFSASQVARQGEYNRRRDVEAAYNNYYGQLLSTVGGYTLMTAANRMGLRSGALQAISGSFLASQQLKDVLGYHTTQAEYGKDPETVRRVRAASLGAGAALIGGTVYLNRVGALKPLMQQGTKYLAPVAPVFGLINSLTATSYLYKDEKTLNVDNTSLMLGENIAGDLSGISAMATASPVPLFRALGLAASIFFNTDYFKRSVGTRYSRELASRGIMTEEGREGLRSSFRKGKWIGMAMGTVVAAAATVALGLTLAPALLVVAGGALLGGLTGSVGGAEYYLNKHQGQYGEYELDDGWAKIARTVSIKTLFEKIDKAEQEAYRHKPLVPYYDHRSKEVFLRPKDVLIHNLNPVLLGKRAYFEYLHEQAHYRQFRDPSRYDPENTGNRIFVALEETEKAKQRIKKALGRQGFSSFEEELKRKTADANGFDSIDDLTGEDKLRFETEYEANLLAIDQLARDRRFSRHKYDVNAAWNFIKKSFRKTRQSSSNSSSLSPIDPKESRPPKKVLPNIDVSARTTKAESFLPLNPKNVSDEVFVEFATQVESFSQQKSITLEDKLNFLIDWGLVERRRDPTSKTNSLYLLLPNKVKMKITNAELQEPLFKVEFSNTQEGKPNLVELTLEESSKYNEAIVRARLIFGVLFENTKEAIAPSVIPWHKRSDKSLNNLVASVTQWVKKLEASTLDQEEANKPFDSYKAKVTELRKRGIITFNQRQVYLVIGDNVLQAFDEMSSPSEVYSQSKSSDKQTTLTEIDGAPYTEASRKLYSVLTSLFTEEELHRLTRPSRWYERTNAQYKSLIATLKSKTEGLSYQDKLTALEDAGLLIQPPKPKEGKPPVNNPRRYFWIDRDTRAELAESGTTETARIYKRTTNEEGKSQWTQVVDNDRDAYHNTLNRLNTILQEVFTAEERLQLTKNIPWYKRTESDQSLLHQQIQSSVQDINQDSNLTPKQKLQAKFKLLNEYGYSSPSSFKPSLLQDKPDAKSVKGGLVFFLGKGRRLKVVNANLDAPVQAVEIIKELEESEESKPKYSYTDATDQDRFSEPIAHLKTILSTLFSQEELKGLTTSGHWYALNEEQTTVLVNQLKTESQGKSLSEKITLLEEYRVILKQKEGADPNKRSYKAALSHDTKDFIALNTLDLSNKAVHYEKPTEGQKATFVESDSPYTDEKARLNTILNAVFTQDQRIELALTSKGSDWTLFQRDEGHFNALVSFLKGSTEGLELSSKLSILKRFGIIKQSKEGSYGAKRGVQFKNPEQKRSLVGEQVESSGSSRTFTDSVNQLLASIFSEEERAAIERGGVVEDGYARSWFDLTDKGWAAFIDVLSKDVVEDQEKIAAKQVTANEAKLTLERDSTTLKEEERLRLTELAKDPYAYKNSLKRAQWAGVLLDVDTATTLTSNLTLDKTGWIGGGNLVFQVGEGQYLGLTGDIESSGTVETWVDSNRFGYVLFDEHGNTLSSEDVNQPISRVLQVFKAVAGSEEVTGLHYKYSSSNKATKRKVSNLSKTSTDWWNMEESSFKTLIDSLKGYTKLMSKEDTLKLLDQGLRVDLSKDNVAEIFFNDFDSKVYDFKDGAWVAREEDAVATRGLDILNAALPASKYSMAQSASNLEEAAPKATESSGLKVIDPSPTPSSTTPKLTEALEVSEVPEVKETPQPPKQQLVSTESVELPTEVHTPLAAVMEMPDESSLEEPEKPVYSREVLTTDVVVFASKSLIGENYNLKDLVVSLRQARAAQEIVRSDFNQASNVFRKGLLLVPKLLARMRTKFAYSRAALTRSFLVKLFPDKQIPTVETLYTQVVEESYQGELKPAAKANYEAIRYSATGEVSPKSNKPKRVDNRPAKVKALGYVGFLKGFKSSFSEQMFGLTALNKAKSQKSKAYRDLLVNKGVSTPNKSRKEQRSNLSSQLRKAHTKAGAFTLTKGFLWEGIIGGKVGALLTAPTLLESYVVKKQAPKQILTSFVRDAVVGSVSAAAMLASIQGLLGVAGMAAEAPFVVAGVGILMLSVGVYHAMNATLNIIQEVTGQRDNKTFDKARHYTSLGTAIGVGGYAGVKTIQSYQRYRLSKGSGVAPTPKPPSPPKPPSTASRFMGNVARQTKSAALTIARGISGGISSILKLFKGGRDRISQLGKKVVESRLTSAALNKSSQVLKHGGRILASTAKYLPYLQALITTGETAYGINQYRIAKTREQEVEGAKAIARPLGRLAGGYVLGQAGALGATTVTANPIVGVVSFVVFGLVGMAIGGEAAARVAEPIEKSIRGAMDFYYYKSIAFSEKTLQVADQVEGFLRKQQTYIKGAADYYQYQSKRLADYAAHIPQKASAFLKDQQAKVDGTIKLYKNKLNESGKKLEAYITGLLKGFGYTKSSEGQKGKPLGTISKDNESLPEVNLPNVANTTHNLLRVPPIAESTIFGYKPLSALLKATTLLTHPVAKRVGFTLQEQAKQVRTHIQNFFLGAPAQAASEPPLDQQLLDLKTQHQQVKEEKLGFLKAQGSQASQLFQEASSLVGGAFTKFKRTFRAQVQRALNTLEDLKEEATDSFKRVSKKGLRRVAAEATYGYVRGGLGQAAVSGYTAFMREATVESNQSGGITIGNLKIKANEYEKLLRLVVAEARSEGVVGQALVANAVLNRVALILSGQTRSGTYNAKSGNVVDVIEGNKQFTPVSQRSSAYYQGITQQERALAEKAIALAVNHKQLRQVLKREGLSDSQINKLLKAVNFRNPNIASNDPSQNYQTALYKRHRFSTTPGMDTIKARSSQDSVNTTFEEEAAPKRQNKQEYVMAGLYTGPRGRMGSGTEWHIDIKLKKTIGIDTAVKLMDQMARGYAEQGRDVVFMNNGVAGIRWNPDASIEEKRKLIQRLDGAHKDGGNRKLFWDIDFFIPKTGTPGHQSNPTTRGAEMVLPYLEGAEVKYQRAADYGNFVEIWKDGKLIMRKGHGDTARPLPSTYRLPDGTTPKEYIPVTRDYASAKATGGASWVNRSPDRKGIPTKFIFAAGHNNTYGQGAAGEKAYMRELLQAFLQEGVRRGVQVEILDPKASQSMSLREVAAYLAQKQKQGYYAMELHGDRSDNRGRSGVIPGTVIDEIEQILAREFGAFPQSMHQGYALPSRNVALLETYAMGDINKLSPEEKLKAAREVAARFWESILGKEKRPSSPSLTTSEYDPEAKGYTPDERANVPSANQTWRQFIKEQIPSLIEGVSKPSSSIFTTTSTGKVIIGRDANPVAQWEAVAEAQKQYREWQKDPRSRYYTSPEEAAYYESMQQQVLEEKYKGANTITDEQVHRLETINTTSQYGAWQEKPMTPQQKEDQILAARKSLGLPPEPKPTNEEDIRNQLGMPPRPSNSLTLPESRPFNEEEFRAAIGAKRKPSQTSLPTVKVLPTDENSIRRQLGMPERPKSTLRIPKSEPFSEEKFREAIGAKPKPKTTTLPSKRSKATDENSIRTQLGMPSRPSATMTLPKVNKFTEESLRQQVGASKKSAPQDQSIQQQLESQLKEAKPSNKPQRPTESRDRLRAAVIDYKTELTTETKRTAAAIITKGQQEAAVIQMARAQVASRRVEVRVNPKPNELGGDANVTTSESNLKHRAVPTKYKVEVESPKVARVTTEHQPDEYTMANGSHATDGEYAITEPLSTTNSNVYRPSYGS